MRNRQKTAIIKRRGKIMPKAVQNLAKKYSLKLYSNGGSFNRTAYGKVNGFETAVSSFRTVNGIGYSVKVFSDFSKDEVNARVKEKLAALKDRKDISEIIIDKALTVIISRRGMLTKPAFLEEIIGAVFEAVKDEDSGALCENCLSSLPLSYIHTSERNDALLLCENCREDLNREFENRHLEKKSQPSNYLSAITAAVVFSLGGVALWIAISLIGFIAGIAGFVIVYLAYFGYKKAGGKINKTALAIILLISVIMVAVSTYLSIGVQLYQELNKSGYEITLGQSFSTIPTLLALEEGKLLLQAIIKDFAIGLLLTALAAYPVFKGMTAEGSKAKVKVLP